MSVEIKLKLILKQSGVDLPTEMQSHDEMAGNLCACQLRAGVHAPSVRANFAAFVPVSTGTLHAVLIFDYSISPSALIVIQINYGRGSV